MNIFQLLFENKLAYIAKSQGPKLEARALEDTKQQMAAADILDKLAVADPTGKQSKYMQWIANQYLKGQFKLEDVNRIKVDLAEFIRVQSKLDKKDINQYSSLPDLYAVLDPLEGEEVQSNRQADKAQEQKFYDSGEAILLANSGSVKIIQLASEPASRYFGRGTKWCTAADEQCMFNHYNGEGPLFVIIVSGKKYQLHIESGQFMDDKDQQLSTEKMKELINIPEVGAVLAKKEQEMGEKYVELCAGDEDGPRNDYLYTTMQNYFNIFIEIAPMATLAKYVAKDTFYVPSMLEDAETRWPAIEPALLVGLEDQDRMSAAVGYAEKVIGGTWPELEKAIVALLKSEGVDGLNAGSIIRYARATKRARWPEFEQWVLDNLDTHINIAIKYAGAMKMKRWPEIEAKAKEMPHTAFDYARQVMDDLWPEAEDVIMQGAFTKGPYESWKNSKERS